MGRATLTPLRTRRATSHLVGLQENEETLAGGGLSCTSASPGPWVDIPCVLGLLLLPWKGAALPTTRPSLQDPCVEQGLGVYPAALGSVRHSQACRLQHGPKVDTSPCHCRHRAASAMTNEPFVKERTLKC